MNEETIKIHEIDSEDDGYVPNGYTPTTTAAGNIKHDFDSTSSHFNTEHIIDSVYVSDEESRVVQPSYGNGPTKTKHTPKWPRRPEQLLKHVCAKCGMEFGKATFMEQHLDNIHSELHLTKNLKIVVTSATEGQCQICGANVEHRSVRDLQMHHFLHLPYKSFKCKCHNYHFQDKQAGLQHLKFHAQQMSLRRTQNHLKETKPKKAPFEGNIILEDGTTYDPDYPETGLRFICPECGEVCANDDTWKEHCTVAHNFKTMQGLNMTKIDGNKVRCNECNTIILNKSDNYKLRRHKVTHSPFLAFHCKLCTYSRKRKEDVLQHIRQSHASKSLICSGFEAVDVPTISTAEYSTEEKIIEKFEVDIDPDFDYDDDDIIDVPLKYTKDWQKLETKTEFQEEEEDQKRKREEEDIATTNDDFQAFGDFIASELRSLNYEHNQNLLRFKIQKTISEVAELDTKEYSNRSQFGT